MTYDDFIFHRFKCFQKSKIMTMPLQVRIKKLVPEAVVPGYAMPGDAGLDMTATSAEFDAATRKLKIGFGIAAEIPPGYVGLAFPRSSVHKTGMTLSNGVGVIDSGYRGEVTAVFNLRRGKRGYIYDVGDRIAQLVVVPFAHCEIEETDELSETERGVGGYGSTGK